MILDKFGQGLSRLSVALCSIGGMLWLSTFMKEPDYKAAFYVTLMVLCVLINIPGAFWLYKDDSDKS